MSNRPGYGSERINQEPTESEEIDFVQEHKKMPVTIDLTPCNDAVSRQVVKEQMIKYGFHAPDMTVTEFVEDLPPVNPQPKTGHWKHNKCDVCGASRPPLFDNFCPNCGAKMAEKGENKE